MAFAEGSTEMRIAIPTWQERVSPVFDVARQLLVVDVGGGGESVRSETVLGEAGPAGRARRLKELGIDVLICGGISRPLEQMLASAGVRVVPYIAGTVDEVLAAFASGQFSESAFSMPGCGGRRMRLRGGRGRGGRGGGRGGRGGGPGRGLGRGG